MRILIATATAGGGHLQAAVAIEEAWRLRHPKDAVLRIDILDFTSRLYRKAYAEGYVRLAEKAPELYAHAFRLSDTPAFVRRITKLRRLSARWVTRKFVKKLRDFKPDLVICPHFLPIEALGSLAQEKRLAPRPHVVCVITDFEAHALWMEPCVDLYCVAMETTQARLVARGIPKNKVAVTGIPISHRFLKPIGSARARRELQLSTQRPCVLVLGGGLGMGPLAETMAQLDQSKKDFQLLVVAGKNEALRKKLAARRYHHPTRVFGFVTQMQTLMAASDVIVTKPGGLTSSEALALGKPLLIVNPLPGQEAANSDFLLEGGAAVRANRLEDLRFRIDQLFQGSRLSRMSQAAKRLGRPLAAAKICKAARALVGLLITVLGVVSSTRADCPLHTDEAAILFPTSVPTPDSGRPWKAEIHGWVFDPETDSAVRAVTQKQMMRSLGIPLLTEESELFKKRMAYFLVDNEGHRALSVQLNGHTSRMEPSDASGHIHGFISIPEFKAPVGSVSTLPLTIAGCEKSAAVTPGQLWLIPSQGVSVLSDIDDTIKVSNVSNAHALILNSFVRPYEPVEGMAALYAAWAKQGAVFHYLSASPWPLYLAMDEFLRTSGFPAGPLEMKHFRAKSSTFLSLFQDPVKYKLPLIRDLLKRYPERDFILVGDSGEKDPEIYGQVAREFGSQVRFIFIRDIHPEFDGQARYRKAFRGLPDSQWTLFTRPTEVSDALTRSRSDVRQEWKAILQYRAGLQDVVQFMDSQPDIFPIKPLAQGRIMSRPQKEILWSTWSRYLEYVLALDSLQASHAAPPRPMHRADRETFLVRYGAFVSEYRWSLELLKRLESDPGFKAILNEPVPEIGLSQGTFDQLKFRFLNLIPAGQFAAMNTVYKTLEGTEAPELRAAIREDETALWEMGQGKGEALTLKNGLQIIQNAGFKLLFPVQMGVSQWMGDTKVWRHEKPLIQPEQIRALRAQLQPGDILLERREWYLSNIGLPGYWPHAALYVGSPAERRAYFGNAAESDLQKQYPKAYTDSLLPYHEHAPSVLEAMSEGVVFTSLEYSGAADSLVVLRPKVSKEAKLQALQRAFHYAGRPYDFNFDFATDSTIVCSELVYKAYEPSPSMKGITFAFETMLGRQVASPNRMAQQFMEEFGKADSQMEMVLFLDGNERLGQAFPASTESFCSSWKRPKWHIWVQEKPTL